MFENNVVVGSIFASFLLLCFAIIIFYFLAVIGLWKFFKKAEEDG